ncbi:family 78 glycoside hydrolase catalytic domain [Microbacterium sp.]|uniref:family 78 glycoside hydrolase catalytic domain n=1 Tax=Microbacterium sp. TaxID=51671 RepID=UPI00333F313D
MSAPVSRVSFEHLGADARGIGLEAPRLSWTGPDSALGYDVEVRFDDGAVVVRRDAGGTSLRPWPTRPLRSREGAVVRVRPVHADGSTAPWSAGSAVEAGLLLASDWEGEFVGSGSTAADDPAPIVFRRLPVDGEVVRARIHATARGLYSLEIDGRRVDDALLEPGWQSYGHRVRYRTYDVTDRMAQGEVTVAAWLADGWYRGRLGFPLIGGREVYGTRLGVLLQVEIDYADGRRDVFATDAEWRWCAGPVLTADLYDGEAFDARRVASLDDASSLPVALLGRPDVVLAAPSGPPVRATQVVRPQRIWRSPSGSQLVDFGQNLVGWLRIRPRGEAGRTVTLRHAEVLDGGELALTPLRTAKAEDRYTLSGVPGEVWEPRFTFHGFRYAQADGWPGELRADDLEAVVIHTDMPRIGRFESSDARLDRLHENVVWGMRGNFVDIPTDCPQRDERLGWTGDIAVFAPTAAYLFDCAGMLTSWLADLALEQHDDGLVPFFVPGLEFPPEVSHLPGLALSHVALWGDAAVLVPMALYESTGDVEILRAQYRSMVAWVEGVARLAGPEHVWDRGFQFGDWLDPTAPPDDPAAGATDPALVATAYRAHGARLLSRAAAALGLVEDAHRFGLLADAVGRAFRRRFCDPRTGALTVDTQTAHAIALRLDLLAPGHREAAGARLVELVRAAGHRLATGFAGTPLLLHALSDAGAIDDAYRVLLQEECPSWLYTVSMGATTIWERWDSMRPDGSVNPGEMTSFNHYAFGSVADWMHRVIGGLSPLEPGYDRFLVAPRPGGGLTRASTSHVSPHGLIEVGWTLTEEDLIVDITVPPGAVAVVDLGDGHPVAERGEGRHRLRTRSRSRAAEVRG